MALTNKQQIFADEYVQCWNRTEAARRAGFKQPQSQGPRLLKNVEIQKAIQQKLKESSMSADEALSRLTGLARGSIESFLEFQDGQKRPIVNLLKAKEAGLLHLIKEVKYNPTGGLEIKLYSAHDALRDIGKHHALFTEKIDLNAKVEIDIDAALRKAWPNEKSK